MCYTKEEVESLWRASVQRKEELVQEYISRYGRPNGRGRIITPEIQAELDEQKRLYGVYFKIREKEKENEPQQ